MAKSRTRSRNRLNVPQVIGTHWLYDWVQKYWRLISKTYAPVNGSTSYRLQETCFDETHPGPPWKDGGPLFIKKWVSPYFYTGGASYQHGIYRYTGSHSNIHPASASEYSTLTARSDLGAVYGATGWNRFRPVKSGADLAQFIGELRDFKSLFRVRLRSFKDLGSAYLNYQFGWKPFVNDIAKFYKSMQKVERTIDFIRRNNNKWITRGGTISRSEQSGPETNPGLRVTPTTFGPIGPATGSYTKLIPHEEERIWYKARMKYYIPDLSADKCENVLTSPLLRRIYGLEVTPALLWELTPWSWLVDWFGNVGDVLANLSSSSYDNLVAKYAYVMRSWSKTTFVNSLLIWQTSTGTYNIKVSSSYVLSTKQRAEAISPYGFHLGWDDLSSYQLSILGALGLSRTRL